MCFIVNAITHIFLADSKRISADGSRHIPTHWNRGCVFFKCLVSDKSPEQFVKNAFIKEAVIVPVIFGSHWTLLVGILLIT